MTTGAALCIFFFPHRDFPFDESMSSFIRVHTASCKSGTKIRRSRPDSRPFLGVSGPDVWYCKSVVIWKQSVKKGSRQKDGGNDWIFHQPRILRECVRSHRCWFSFSCQQMRAGQTGQRVACHNKSFDRFLLCKSIRAADIRSRYAQKLMSFLRLSFPPL